MNSTSVLYKAYYQDLDYIGEAWERGDKDILHPGILYSIALLSRLGSNEGLLIILVFSSTDIVVLEERIDAFLVHFREA
jgi:hypothetical protein